jgi:hypothetical protein
MVPEVGNDFCSQKEKAQSSETYRKQRLHVGNRIQSQLASLDGSRTWKPQRQRPGGGGVGACFHGHEIGGRSVRVQGFHILDR